MKRRTFLGLLAKLPIIVAASTIVLPEVITVPPLSPVPFDLLKQFSVPFDWSRDHEANAFALGPGDVFTIEEYYARQPVTGRELRVLQSFVVTADAHGGYLPIESVHPKTDITSRRFKIDSP